MENYPYIPFVPDRKTVLRRLRSARADFSKALDRDIDRYVHMGQTLFHARGKAAVFDIVHIDKESFVLQGEVISSALLTKMLKSSSRAYLMCATIPQREVDKISEAIAAGEGLKGLVLDAYASEYVDGVFDVMVQRKNAALKRTGQMLTKKRFSAGYGDLDIRYQKLFFDMLDMQTLDVHINEKYLLAPEKSVIAIAGVR